MLIGCGTGVAVGLGVTVGVGVETGVVVAVVVSVLVEAGGMDMLAGATVCAIQADTKRAIATTTNKVFFITELLLTH